ncbi:hypothetical protein QL285_070598 [Trifolium repens]|nr:hypothetical protein QL285_070598 [Trifolium repens]
MVTNRVRYVLDTDTLSIRPDTLDLLDFSSLHRSNFFLPLKRFLPLGLHLFRFLFSPSQQASINLLFFDFIFFDTVCIRAKKVVTILIGLMKN